MGWVGGWSLCDNKIDLRWRRTLEEAQDRYSGLGVGKVDYAVSTHGSSLLAHIGCMSVGRVLQSSP